MPASSPKPGQLVKLTGWAKVPRKRPGIVLGRVFPDGYVEVQWCEPGQTGGTTWSQWHPVSKLSVISAT